MKMEGLTYIEKNQMLENFKIFCVNFFSSWNIMAKAELEYSLIFYGMYSRLLFHSNLESNIYILIFFNEIEFLFFIQVSYGSASLRDCLE